MKGYFLSFLSLMMFLPAEDTFSQKTKAAIPFSIKYHLDQVTEFENMPSFDVLKASNEENTDRLKKQKFARLFEVNFHPFNSGSWEESPEGRVWRLGIRSAGAYSLYEVFGSYNLKKGVKLFVYNEPISDFAGAFTSENNNPSDILTIAPLPGETVIIELNVPIGITDFGELKLTQLWHDYLNKFGDNRLKSPLDDPSESCHVDINCPQGADYQIEKNAVCRILINGTLCTGTLINNAAGEKIPYLITACHCVGDSFSAAASIFFFGYERPVCGQAGDEKAYSLYGSDLIATTNRQLDFSLLKLYDYPPAGYNPYFAGWNLSEDAPDKGVCIHHPIGDVKKISVENNSLITGDFGEGFDTNSHWLVSRWETGSTEGGSSGAPFFDASGRLRGTLSGGDANCKKPVNDFFTKIDLSWDFYPDPVNQLKYWLDPENSGKLIVEGFFPYDENQGHQNTYSNAKDEIKVINQNNLESGSIAGHNSLYFTGFAEKFYNSTPMQLSGLYIGVHDWSFSNIFSTFSIKVWKGQDKPNNEIYSQEVFYMSLIRSTFNYFYFDSLINVSDTFFVGFSINYGFLDTIKAYTSANRGLDGSSYMYVYDGLWHNINEVTDPAVNTSLSVGIISPDKIDTTFRITRQLKLSPNPCTDYLRIDFSNDIIPSSLECYDVTGKKMKVKSTLTNAGIRVNTTDLSSGIYTLIMNSNQDRWQGRFAVIR